MLLAAVLAVAAGAQPAAAPPVMPASASQSILNAKEALQFGVEWRLIRAGLARVTWAPSPNSYHAALHLESAGLVSKLYKVNDDYTANIATQLCAESYHLRAEEGKRRRETKVTFDRGAGKSHYLERDLLKNTTVLAKELEVPACVHEVVGGLYRLRTLQLQPGQSAQVPFTDGKKFANVKVDAQERELIKTPTGNYNAIRHEAHIFNNVIYRRNARAFIWLTDDARRLPVQIQVRMRFLIGTITLTLEKIERS